MEILPEFKKKIQELNQRFFLALENFKDQYVLYLKNPDNENIAADITYTQSVVDSIDSDALLLNNQMDSLIDKDQNIVLKFNNRIDSLKEKNEILKDNAERLYKQSETAQGLFKDEYNWYLSQLKTIFIMLIGVLIGSKIFYDLKLNKKDIIIAIGTVLIFGLIIEKIIMYILNRLT